MKRKVRSYMEKEHMIFEKSQVTVALSGGGDSVALLLVLKSLEEELDIKINAIHVEHGIRGDESLADAEFAKTLCDDLQVPLQVVSVDVPSYAKEQGMGLEEAARKLRYKAFEQSGAKVVALAHHRDDQAETVLFQMVRGSGVKGLSGMAPVREDSENKIKYIRPLLDISRDEIDEYLRSNHQDYCVDSTNVDIEYSRNRIRCNVLPEMELINAGAKKHLADIAAHLREVDDYLELETNAAFAECVSSQFEVKDYCQELSLDLQKLEKLHPAIATRVVRKAIVELTNSLKDVEAVHVEAILSLIDKAEGSAIHLPYLMKAYRDENEIALLKVASKELYEELSAPDEAVEISPEILSAKQLEELKNSGKELCLEIKDTNQEMVWKVKISVIKNDTFFLKNTCTKTLAYDKIKEDMVLRSRCEGDWFYLNEKQDRKNVNREFIDRKIPEEMRSKILLVADSERVLAVCGNQEISYEGRVSYDMYVSDDTDYLVTIELI